MHEGQTGPHNSRVCEEALDWVARLVVQQAVLRPSG